jgi:hypothetical protein
MAFSLFGIFAVLLETIRPYLLLILIIVAIDLLVTAMVFWRGGRSWTVGRAPALLGGLAVGVLTFFLAPRLTSARFSDLSGLLDWLSLIGGAVGAALVAALLLWPLATLLFGHRIRS